MGAYSPAPVVSDAVYQRIMDEVIHPTIKGMADEGHAYTGFLYAGLMITDDGAPKVIEYNCRFGDPETQPIMMRLQSDLSALCLAAIDGKLSEHNSSWDERPSVGVVLAAGGYPGSYGKGDQIFGLEEADSETVKVFHAGTKEGGGKVLTNGGRVLCVTALGDSVTDAQAKAYAACEKISWAGVYKRNDIAFRAIEREAN